jgi:tripartite-type tricarboxylate transporter receptor subunit TctC
MIVPFAAGGTMDIVARTVAEQLRDAMGQPITVENRPGAGGNTGADLVAKAAPDGYTLLVGTNATHTINPFLFKSMPYDAAKDFMPVANLGAAANVMVVHASVPATTLKDFIALAKARPGAYSYATAGSGSTGHLATEMLKANVGIDLVHVPYKSGPAAVTDTVAGHTQVLLFTPPAVLPHIRSGAVRALATTGPQRLALLPDVPTMAEAGVPGFVAVAWYGVFVPAGTPQAVVERLDQEVARALQRQDVRDKLNALGVDVTYLGPKQFADFLRADAVKWAKAVKDSGATVD